MKTFFAILLALLTLGASGMSVDQLEKGAAAYAVSVSKDKQDVDQMADGMLFMGYYWGYFQSIQNEDWRVPEDAARPELRQPADWMFDLSKGSASLLSFLRSYRPLDAKKLKTMPAGPVMTAWVLWNCPTKEAECKFTAIELLKKQYGEDFNGLDEMIRQLAPIFTNEVLLEMRREEAEAKANKDEDDPKATELPAPQPDVAAQRRYLDYLKKIKAEQDANKAEGDR